MEEEVRSWQTEGKVSGGKGKHGWKGNIGKDADMEDLQVEVRQSQLKGNVTLQTNFLLWLSF